MAKREYLQLLTGSLEIMFFILNVIFIVLIFFGYH